jgi:hypothetical protein
MLLQLPIKMNQKICVKILSYAKEKWDLNCENITFLQSYYSSIMINASY